MRDENQQRGHGTFAFVIGIILGLAIGWFVGVKGYVRFEDNKIVFSDEQQDGAVEDVVVEPSFDEPALAEEPALAQEPSQPVSDPKAVEMVSYSHDWLEHDAQISVKNNTTRDITSITGRMVYYDMSGNMLDYQDFTRNIDVERGMTKRFSLPGYNYEEDYAYYKNEARSNKPNNRYKVTFILKSYTIK